MPQTKKSKIDFAQLCLGIRTKKGWTQQQMADYLDTPLRSYKRWEYGEVKPNADAAYKIAQLDLVFLFEEMVHLKHSS